VDGNNPEDVETVCNLISQLTSLHMGYCPRLQVSQPYLSVNLEMTHEMKLLLHSTNINSGVRNSCLRIQLLAAPPCWIVHECLVAVTGMAWMCFGCQLDSSVGIALHQVLGQAD